MHGSGLRVEGLGIMHLLPGCELSLGRGERRLICG